MPDASFDLKTAHRWFAVECNNEAWALLEDEDRTDPETERMIHVAHAALYHWSQVGTALNRFRALYLLAKVYVEAGEPEGALHWADAALETGEDLDDATDFDLLCAQASAVEALMLVGEDQEAAALREEARAAYAVIEDEEEREVLAKFFSEVLSEPVA